VATEGASLSVTHSAEPDRPRTVPAEVAGRRFPSIHQHAIAVFALGFFLAYGFVFMRRPERSEWQTCYVSAASRLRVHTTIAHGNPPTYPYPPAMAMLAVPFTWFSPAVSLLIWYGINVAATTVVVTLAWRLAGRPRFGVTLLGLLLSGRFLLAPLENHQFDMVIAAVLFVGCYSLWRGRDRLAGVWIGLAAAMKCTPLLFAPYLAWRGKALAACLVLLVAVFLNVLPDLYWPQTNGSSYLADWYHLCLQTPLRKVPGAWGTDPLLNQSLAGLVYRWAGWHDSILTNGQLRVMLYATIAVLVTLVGWRMRGARHAPPAVTADRPSPHALAEIQTAVECSAVTALMLLASPMSGKAHYVVLVLPCIVLARVAVEVRPWWSLPLLAVLFVSGPFTAKGLIGKPLGDLTLAWALPTLFATASLAGIWLTLGLCRTNPPHHAGTQSLARTASRAA